MFPDDNNKGKRSPGIGQYKYNILYLYCIFIFLFNVQQSKYGQTMGNCKKISEFKNLSSYIKIGT